jgi:hypothetical protein
LPRHVGIFVLFASVHLTPYLMAIGLIGEPTAPVTRNGGAMSWNS